MKEPRWSRSNDLLTLMLYHKCVALYSLVKKLTSSKIRGVGNMLNIDSKIE